ncbi:bifunctional oligoribonuclease/PAP phosphatase NrnA [soil metagenome]
MSAAPLEVVPPARAAQLGAVLERLLDARRVVLSTHINADGDAAGSTAAAAAWLEARGIQATIVHPTRSPAQYRFLLHRPDVVVELADASAAIAAADLFLVLDTSEPHRLGELAQHLPPERTLVVDHHPVGAECVGDLAVQDTSAAAAAELVHDLLVLAGGPWPPSAVLGIYVGLVTDTGSFRYSNTTPRAHAIAARLLEQGVDPEAVYQRLFATVPLHRVELLREALARLDVDQEAGLAWIVIPSEIATRLGAESEDFEGLVEHARSIQGTEVAMLFRETPEGETKISFRSNGMADVNRLAREFGGGGHVKAAGAKVSAPAEEVVPRVLAAARAAQALSASSR